MSMGKKLFAIMFAALMAVSVLAGCGVKPAATEMLAPALSSENDTDPNAPYYPRITISTVLRTVPNTEYADGHSATNTIWTEQYDRMGIDIEYLWQQEAAQYEDRLFLAINSGDIPDVMRVYDPQAALMARGGMLYDLTDVFEKYASEVTKEQMMYPYDGAYMAGAYMKGRLMMLPYEADSARDWCWPLWIRSDWLENVGLEPPKTMDDFLAVCEAFVNGDPKKDGKKDTYGLAVAGMDNLLMDWGSLGPFFTSYNAQPGWWFSGQLFYEIEDGKVIWSGAKPGVKEALKVLQDMYKKKYIAIDFSTIDSGERMTEDLVGEKVGMFFGDYWVGGWPLNILRESNPEADWFVVAPPTVDGKPTRQERYQPASSWTVVSAACKNPEAIIRMLNLSTEIWYGMDGKDPRKVEFQAKPGVRDGGMGVVCALVRFNSPSLAEVEWRALAKAIETGDASDVPAGRMPSWEDIKMFMDDPLHFTGWAQHNENAPEPGKVNYWIYEEMVKNHPYIDNAYMGLLTDLMADLFPIYHSMATEKVTRIIIGEDSVDSWDELVAQWSALGNDEIIAEIESLR